MFGKKKKQTITRLEEEIAQYQNSLDKLESYIATLTAPECAGKCEKKKAAKKVVKKTAVKKDTKVAKNVKKTK